MAAGLYYDDGIRDEDNWGVEDLADLCCYYPEVHGVHINGGNGKDIVRVSLEDNGATLDFFVQLNNTQGGHYRFAVGAVPKIFFHGFGGNDEFTNNSSTECFAWGGSGHDTIVGGDGKVHVWGEANNDTIIAGAPATEVEIWGGTGNDVIHGSRQRDTIHGEDGNDTIIGYAGSDSLYGEMGADKLYGGDDNDFLSGGYGNDLLYGEIGSDILWAGPSQASGFLDNDKLYGGRGLDALYGGAGDDYLDGGADGVEDYLAGELGADTFRINYTPGTYNREDNYADLQEAQGDVLSGIKAKDKLGVTPSPFSKPAGFSQMATGEAAFAAELPANIWAMIASEQVSTLPVTTAVEPAVVDPVAVEPAVVWTQTYVVPTEPLLLATPIVPVPTSPIWSYTVSTAALQTTSMWF